MRTVTLLLLVLAAFAGPLAPLRGSTPTRPAPENPTSGFDHTHRLWTEVLREHVREGGVDYAKLKEDHAALDAYLVALQAVTPEQLKGWTRDQRFAFWINAYNAHVVDLILDNYPVKSIQDLGTMMTKVWKRPLVPLNALHPEGKDKELSFDDIEHLILRPHFEDARVHVAVNCASESCPPLRAEAYVADRLDKQLDEQATAWLANESLNQYDRTATRVKVSKLFEWFERDFMRETGSVQAWIAKYAPAQHRSWIKNAQSLKIEYLEYSWKLNDASS